MDQTREFFNPKCCHLSFTNLLQLGVSINVSLCYILMGLDRYSNVTSVTERVAKLLLKSNGLYIGTISNKTWYQCLCGGICHLLNVFLLHYCLKNNSGSAGSKSNSASPFMCYTGPTKCIYAQSLTRLLKVLSKRTARVWICLFVCVLDVCLHAGLASDCCLRM